MFLIACGYILGTQLLLRWSRSPVLRPASLERL